MRGARRRGAWLRHEHSSNASAANYLAAGIPRGIAKLSLPEYV